jgi:hypothetical protein
MARITHVKKAQQRFKTVPVIDPETGEQKVTPVLRKDGTPKTTKTGRAIVRRVTTEDKSQPLPNRRCGKCGTEIKVGDPYKWVALGGAYGGHKKYACSSCQFRQSDLTSSDKLSQLYVIQENLEDLLNGEWSQGDLAGALEEASGDANGVAEEYTESADNIEEGFGHETYQSGEIREKAEACEEWASALEDAASEIENMDDPDADESEIAALIEGEVEIDKESDDFDEDEYDAAIQQKRDDLREEMESRANDAMYELSL